MTTNTKIDYAAQLALFLLDQTGSVWGRYRGRMTAKEQRALFGRFLGKGVIIIDGADETLCMKRTACFGTTWDEVGYTTWAAL